MKVLIVCSGNSTNFDFSMHQAFIYDQIQAIDQLNCNVEFDYFFIKGKGIFGYLSNLKKLKSLISEKKTDIVHAHFALSGLLANIQRNKPVLTTFHGSDINNLKSRIISFFVGKLNNKSIYVSQNLIDLAMLINNRKTYMIPCGVDFNVFKPMETTKIKEKWDIKDDKKYILFSSSFNNPVKNYNLLREAVGLLNNITIEVIELVNKTREDVAELMNVVDVCVMTSFSEGSPQFIKEAMACNVPIVSTDVGDVKEVIRGVEGCYISSNDTKDVAEKIMMAFAFNNKTNGRERIKQFDNKKIAKKLITLYKKMI